MKVPARSAAATRSQRHLRPSGGLRALDTILEAQTVAVEAELKTLERAERRFEAGAHGEATSLAKTVIQEDPTTIPTDQAGSDPDDSTEGART